MTLDINADYSPFCILNLMHRPGIKPKKTRLASMLSFLVYAFLLGSLVTLTLSYNHLPDKVPIDFNWPAIEGGLGSKNMLWFAPLIFGGISIVLLRLADRPWILNYPTRITEVNAKRQYATGAMMLQLLSFLIALTCLFLVIGALTSLDTGLKPLVEAYYAALPFLFFGLPIFFLFKLAFGRDR